MNHVMFKCPVTGATVDTGMAEAQYAAVQESVGTHQAFMCTACGLMHHCYKGEGWVEARTAEK